MSSTVLEQLRAAQEDIESYERAIVSVLHEKPRNVSARMCDSLRQRLFLTWILSINSIARACFMATRSATSWTLSCNRASLCMISTKIKTSTSMPIRTVECRLVADLVSDRTFAEETESMRGRAVFTSFYEQLKSIRTFHRKYPNTSVSHEPSMGDALNPQVAVCNSERKHR